MYGNNIILAGIWVGLIFSHTCANMSGFGGPLWNHLAFGFESKNGVLKHMFHGKAAVINQLLFNVDVMHTRQLVRPHVDRTE